MSVGSSTFISRSIGMLRLGVTLLAWNCSRFLALGNAFLLLFCTLYSISSSPFGSLLQRIPTSLLHLFANWIVGIDIHRVGAHKHRISLREVVAYKRRIFRDKHITRLLPILSPIAKDQHLLRAIINLDIAFQAHIVAVAVIVECVAQQLLIFG